MAGSTGGSRASARTRKRSQKATPSESDHQPSATAAQASSSSVPPPAATTTTTAASTSSARKPRTTTTKRGARAATKNAGGGNLTDASSAKASSVDLAGYDDLLYSSSRGGGGGGEDVKPDLQQHYASGSEPPHGGVDVNAPGYLAPDYTLNPAGPASSADIDFKCPKCDKTYRGKHARSIWRRHLQDKHGIPLAAQPRRTRWDNDANRPKSEEEKRTRTLESKRRWARKNRAEKGSVTGSARKTRDDTRPPTPSVAGSVGTPATDDEDDDFERPGDLYAGAGDGRGFVSANLLPLPLPPPPNGGFIDDEEGDSSFDAGSVGGWSAEGPPGLARGGSAPLGYPPPSSSSSHAHYPPPPPPLMQHPHHHGHSSSYASAPSPSNPFYPQPSLYGYPVGRRTPTRSAANGHGHGEGGGGGGGVGGGIGGDSYLVAIAAAAATTRGAGPSAAALSSSSSTALPPLPAATADGGGGSDVRRSSRRRVPTARRRDGGGALADEDDDDAEGHELPPLPQLSYHHHQASSSSSGGGGGNPYSQPFHPHATAQDQPHGPPLASTFAHHHHSHPHQYYHDNGANARPLSPMLLSAAGAASSASSGGYAPPRPHSNPNPVFPSPYDMPRALPVPPVSPGAPAPVAMPYYARRQSPARVVTTTSGIAGGMGMGMGSGIPAPTSGSNAHREAVNAQGGLESPVKLRRTGLNGKGKEAIHRAGGASTTTSNGGQGGGGAGNDAGGAVRGPHREDAAGILLALKAGPSSPMAPHVQSPVSSIRGSGPPSMSMMGAPMGRGRRTPLRRRKGKGVHEGGDGDEDDHDHEEEEEDDDDEDDGAVQSLMLRSRAGQQASASNGPLSPWRAAMHAGSTSTSSSTSHLPPNMTPTAAEALSPRKRGRSTSPVPMLASTSSSGEGGSTAAAHALLATAKKAHHQYAVAGGAGGGSETGPSWRTEASLVATPTPGNMMRMIESSPVVRFEQRGSAHLGGGRRHHHDDDGDDEDDDAAVGELTSEGDMMRPPTEADDDDNGGADRQRGGESFSSSSGGGRRSRGRASLENERRRRGGAAGAGGGSSSSGTGAGSSSAVRPLHHHHPAGLTSELGEFDIQPSSSSSGGRTQQHHHHDPLRELDAMLPGSSSSGGGASQAHLVTPAPAGSAALRRTVSDNGPPPPRQVATHPHDPFVAAGVMAEGILPLSGAALSNLARQTEPQSFVFSSPRHPVFSEKLGLTATPGPGVLYTRAGGETPARGSHAANGADDASSAGGRIRELSGSNTSGDDDAKALKTPVMGRLFATSLPGGGDGRRGGGPAPPTSSVGMPASDIDSMGGEDESETTGTAGTGRESQSPGKATVDDDYEDDDGYSEA